MIVRLMLFSGNEMVLHLVGEFAKGLGFAVDAAPANLGRGLRMELPDAVLRGVLC